ncbi:MarR family winged helix-turn-helix transcriptional regulator [Burkholderia pseudomultivorans]|uniref:MarR family protein n=2 Tax=Burkholderia cepacia complex TaxID=87882 RepID=A0AAN0RM78_9BURK|nr:MarR family transcriptional regulator [Burkholderia pseudomultivorans]AIO30307.1 marR family protein [Burkholderia cenocepacia]KWF68756.1 transcriptional regulator [Burkholderia pseudomultivorans]
MSKVNPSVVQTTIDSEAPDAAFAKLSPDMFDSRGRTVPWMARTVHRLYDAQGQKLLDRVNLPVAYWYYLRILAERGELNQLELSKRVGVASTTAVPALDNLEKRGLVQRVRDPKDRRKYYVSLKEDGKRLIDEMLPEMVDMFVLSLEGVSPKEMRVFWKVAHQIEKNLIQMAQGDTALD